MKISIFFRCQPLLSVLTCLSFGLLAGCAFEVENPDNPAPISPKDRAAADSPDSSTKPTSGRGEVISQPAQNIPLPTLNCNISVSKGEANSSGKEGAVIELAEASASDGSTLLLRTLSNGSFLDVKDIVFNRSSVLSSGTYTFEYHKPNGETCFVLVLLESSDIDQKIKLTVTASRP